MTAQALTQRRAGPRGALLLHGGVPADSFDRPWPAGVPLQIHAMEGDEWAEVDILRGLAAEVADAELHLYPGAAHLFTDNSLGEYDEAATRLLTQHTLAFLDRVG